MSYEEAEKKYKPEGITDGYYEDGGENTSIFPTLHWGFGRLPENKNRLKIRIIYFAEISLKLPGDFQLFTQVKI